MGNIIETLEAERDRLTEAINALRGGAVRRRGTVKRHLSAEAREKIARAQRKRWKAQRANAAAGAAA